MKKTWTGICMGFCAAIAVGVAATNTLTASATVYLPYDLTETDVPPVCTLTLEEAKVKNMRYWGYYTVDGEEDAWYFSNDGTATGNPEIRFITEGTQTQNKPYTLTPMTVGSFSFQYAIVNEKPAGVVDLSTQEYIVQILASDGTYPIIPVEIEDDGDWHTITVDSNTLFYGQAEKYGSYSDKFCGFLFKMGQLDGEFLIKDIHIYDEVGTEIAPEEDSEDVSSETEVSSSEAEETSSETEVSSSEAEESSSEAETESSEPIVDEPTVTGEEEKDGGCKSTVGGLTLTAIAAAATVIGLCKKKKE